MKRLTKGYLSGNYSTIEQKCGCATSAKLGFYEAINKLGQLEDTEEDLDIDLNVFSKVLYALDKECVYVKAKKRKQYDGYSLDEETGEIERRLIVGLYRYTNGTRDWFFTISSGDRSSVNHYSLNEYGKTWALTKEELE